MKAYNIAWTGIYTAARLTQNLLQKVQKSAILPMACHYFGTQNFYYTTRLKIVNWIQEHQKLTIWS